MKRLSIILFFLTAFIFAKAQIPADSTYPTKQSVANTATTIMLSNAIKVNDGYVNAIFADTTTANLYAQGGKIKFYPLAQIGTYKPSAGDSGTVWIRNGLATKWIRGSGAIDITSLTFNSDTSGTICFGNGTCVNFAINNLFDVVTNIVQNFNDSNITQINDSTLIICTGQGAAQVCDTIHLGSTNSYYFLSPDSLVTCDTVQFICTVPDSCYQQQLCDTIVLSHPVTAPIHQNLLRPLPEAPNITEGGSAQFDLRGGMNHNTWYYLNQYQLSLEGFGFGAPLNVRQGQWTQLSSSIQSWNHYGAYQPTWNNLDENNQVKLRFNYTDPFIIPVAGRLAGDTVGFLGNEYAYLLMTNSEGATNSYAIDDYNAKQVGMALYTYGSSLKALSLFGNKYPSAYIFPGNNPTDTTLEDAVIVDFYTDKSSNFKGKVYLTNGRLEPDTALITAANNLTLGLGNVNIVSGSTQITAITTSGWQAGSSVIVLKFSGAPLVKNNTAGGAGTATLLLAGRVDFQAAAGDVLSLMYDGTNWNELNRTLAGTVSSFTVRNGLTDSLGVGLLGGTLYKTSTITTNSYKLIATGSGARTMDVTNTNNSGIPLYVTGQQSEAIHVESTGTQFLGRTTTALTNTQQSVFNVIHNSSGTAAANFGLTFDFYLGSATIADRLSNQFISKWTTATDAIRTSQLDVTGVNSGATQTIMSAHGTGVVGIGIATGYTGTRLEVVDNSLAGTSMAYFHSSSTAATGNTQRGLDVQLTGANVNASQNTRAIYANNAHTGAGTNFGIDAQARDGSTNYGVAGSSFGGSVNYGLSGTVSNSSSINYGLYSSASGSSSTNYGAYIQASGGTNNYGIIVPDGGGNVGIGTSTPTATRLEIVDNSLNASMVKLTSTSTAGTGTTHKMLEILTSGANVASGASTYGIEVNNTHTGSSSTNVGISGIANGGNQNIGVLGTSTLGTAVNAVGTSGYGMYAIMSGGGTAIVGESTTGLAGRMVTRPSSTNTTVELFRVNRQTSGTPAAGIGASLGFYLNTNNGSGFEDIANRIKSSLTDVTYTAQTSTLTLTGVLGGTEVDLLTLAGDGSVKLRPITATAASAITPAEGMIVFTSNTNGTFTSVGFWGYQGGAWVKM